jgi:signal transduction histidine kinase
MVQSKASWNSRPAILGAAAGLLAAIGLNPGVGAGLASRVVLFVALIATGYLAGFAVSARRRIAASAAEIARLKGSLRASQDHLMEHGSSRSLAAWLSGTNGALKDAMTALEREARALAAEPGLTDAARAAVAKVAERAGALAKAGAPLAAYSLPDPSRAPFDINTLMREALDLCLHRAGEKKIRFEEAFAVVPPVFGPATRVRDALLNVVVNAVESMPFGGGTIRIETAVDGDHVVARVRDGGIGIRPEHMGKVTDPFFTTKPEKSGAGLGLWETRATIEGIGGSLEIASVPHQGTVVTITLPQAAPLSPGRVGVAHPEEIPRNTADEGDRRIA